MAIALEDKENVDGPTAAYPNGNIRDNDGTGNGTPVNKLNHADFHQFFARILVEAGITPNGLPDNAYDGFQYIDALKALIDNDLNKDWITTGLVFGLNWSASGGYGFGFRKIRGVVHLRGRIQKAAGNPNAGDVIFTLPVGYRPLVGPTRLLVASGSSTGATNYVDISLAGVVTIQEMGISFGNPLSNSSIHLDNLQFDVAH